MILVNYAKNGRIMIWGEMTRALTTDTYWTDLEDWDLNLLNSPGAVHSDPSCRRRETVIHQRAGYNHICCITQWLFLDHYTKGIHEQINNQLPRKLFEMLRRDSREATMSAQLIRDVVDFGRQKYSITLIYAWSSQTFHMRPDNLGSSKCGLEPMKRETHLISLKDIKD